MESLLTWLKVLALEPKDILLKPHDPLFKVSGADLLQACKYIFI